jgi:chemotaxis protein histidine kinase CheA
MKKVNTPGVQPRHQIHRKRVQEQGKQNRQLDVKRDVSEAKENAVSTLGGSKRAESKDKTKKTPKESVTLSTPRAEGQEKPKTSQEDAQKVENQTESQPSAPKEKTSEDFKTDFLNSFADNLDEKAASEIAKKTGSSMAEIAQNGGGQSEAEPVLAAHTRNYAKSVLNEKMPNASVAEIREAAKSDPEIAKAVNLMDASSSYMKQVVKEAKAEGPKGDGAKPVAPGDSDIGGPPQTPGAQGPQAGVDPFAAHRAASGGQQPPSDGGGDGETGPQPPGGGGPQSPYHLSPEKQAAMMAENNATMMEVSKIYTQMFADMQKAAAERHQIMAETAQSISDIMMSIHANRQRSFAKHHSQVLTMLTDSWG